MEVWVFLVAAFVSLPKQIAAVYLGTGTVDANGNSEPPPSLSLSRLFPASCSSVPPRSQCS